MTETEPTAREGEDGAISLRPIGAEDEEFLCRLYASTRQEELAPLDWSDEQKDAFLRMQFDAQARHYEAAFPGGEFQVILREGRPIGRLYLARLENVIRIVDIALLPGHRREGIGTKLIRRVLDEGAAAGKPVRIHVETFNPAMRLYERLGFRPFADKGVYLEMEWKGKQSMRGHAASHLAFRSILAAYACAIAALAPAAPLSVDIGIHSHGQDGHDDLRRRDRQPVGRDRDAGLEPGAGSSATGSRRR